MSRIGSRNSRLWILRQITWMMVDDNQKWRTTSVSKIHRWTDIIYNIHSVLCLLAGSMENPIHFAQCWEFNHQGATLLSLSMTDASKTTYYEVLYYLHNISKLTFTAFESFQAPQVLILQLLTVVKVLIILVEI